MPLLFVYGTLRRGEPNHAQIKGARFVGPARTAARFTLMEKDGFRALVAGGVDAASGEVYEVDPSHLSRLDEFEEHPRIYTRTAIPLEDGRRAEAYLRR